MALELREANDCRMDAGWHGPFSTVSVCPVGDVDPGEISRKALKGWGPGLWGSRREPVSTLWTCPRQATGRERMVAKEHTRDRCKDGWGSVTQREQSEGVGHKEKAWKTG